MIFRNLVAVSPTDLGPMGITPPRDGSDISLMVNGKFVVAARPIDNLQPGHLGLSEPQRTWMAVALTDVVSVERYDHFNQGGQYVGAMDVEVGFASKNKRIETPYDQDELGKIVTQVYTVERGHRSCPLIIDRYTKTKS